MGNQSVEKVNKNIFLLGKQNYLDFSKSTCFWLFLHSDQLCTMAAARNPQANRYVFIASSQLCPADKILFIKFG